jgi:hypothetical protein
MKFLIKFTETNFKQILLEARNKNEAKFKFNNHIFQDKNVVLKGDEIELTDLVEMRK